MLSQNELAESFEATLKLVGAEGRTRLLADCTALGGGGHSVVDLYFLSDTLAATEGSFTLKEALLLPRLPTSADNVKFWETTSKNRGLSVQVFENRQAALDWLLQ